MADKDFRVKQGIVVGGDAFISNSITSVNSISFLTTEEFEPGRGSLAWANNDGTLALGLSDTLHTHLNQDTLYYVINQSGFTIPANTVVMANGTVGNSGSILVSPAIGNGSFPSEYVMGVATHNIADGADGYVTAFGKIRGINTSMFSEGDILYLNPAIPGTMMNTAPVAPNNKVTVAIVVTKSVNQGEIFVRPTFTDKLSSLEDVHTVDVSDGQSLVWVAANSRFENQTITVSSDEANLYNTYTTLTANDYNSFTTLTANIYNTFAYLNANVGGGGDASNAWVNANDYATLLSAQSNDYNSFTTLTANTYNTLLAAQSNDGATLLTAQANDYNSYTTLTANTYNSYLTLTANDGVTLLTALSNDGATLDSARANDYNSFTTLTANTYNTLLDTRANDFNSFTTLTANIYNTFAYLNANVGGGGGDVANAWVNANDYATYITLQANLNSVSSNVDNVTANLYNTYTSLANVYSEKFEVDGSTNVFTLSRSITSEEALLVYLDGVLQHSDSYVISGTTLTIANTTPIPVTTLGVRSLSALATTVGSGSGGSTYLKTFALG
jgi:hypothetical protein